jgi:hypothetical protein
MKAIKQSPNKPHWPRNRVQRIECRKRDLIIRIANWLRDKEEPAYDVEVYIGGVYDWRESQTFSLYEWKKKATAKKEAVKFAQNQIEKLL